MIAERAPVTDHLRVTLGVESFDECVAHGATMTTGTAAMYSRREIRAALDELPDTERPARALPQRWIERASRRSGVLPVRADVVYRAVP